MVQRAFMLQIFRRCKQLGLHTCLDTSGRLGDKLTDLQSTRTELAKRKSEAKDKLAQAQQVLNSLTAQQRADMQLQDQIAAKGKRT